MFNFAISKVRSASEGFQQILFVSSIQSTPLKHAQKSVDKTMRTAWGQEADL